MPYASNADLPDAIKVLPGEAQSVWRRVFNENTDKGEDSARKIAWTAVKNGWKQTGDNWVKKASEAQKLSEHKILFDAPLPELTDGPVWIWLACVGNWHSNEYGEFGITLEDLQTGVKNFNRTSRKTVFDFEHSFDDPDVPPHQRIASGKPIELEIRGSELWGLVDWTPGAREAIRKGDFQHFSPTFTDTFINKDTGKDQGWTLIGGALTNRPFIDNQPRVAAKESIQEEKDMSMKQLVEVLNVSEDKVLETVKTLIETASKVEAEKVKTLTEANGKIQKLTEENTALKGSLGESEKKLKASVEKSAKERWEAITKEALEKGKILAAELNEGSVLMELHEKLPELAEKMIEERADGSAVKLGTKGSDDADLNAPQTWEEAVKRVQADDKELSDPEAIRIAKDVYPPLFNKGVPVPSTD